MSVTMHEESRASELSRRLKEIEQAAFVAEVSWLNHRLCRSEVANELFRKLVHATRDLGELERLGCLSGDQIEVLREARISIGVCLGGICECACASCVSMFDWFADESHRMSRGNVGTTIGND